VEPLKKQAVDLLVKTFLLAMILLATACNSEPENRNEIGTDMVDNPATLRDAGERAMPELTFEDTLFKTGRITQGEVLNYTYSFTNTGTAPLLITTVTASCGCTVPRSYPQGKIMPGESGDIDVEFDSDNKSGEQTVEINVSANTIPALTRLRIVTDIVVPDNMMEPNRKGR
jgi:hypothetical protein